MCFLDTEAMFSCLALQKLRWTDKCFFANIVFVLNTNACFAPQVPTNAAMLQGQNPPHIPSLSRPCLHTYSTFFQLRLTQARPPQPTKEIPPFFLVDTLEGRDSLALILIQRVADYSSVGEVHLAMWLLLERQAVLHPVLVVSVGEVFSGVSTSGFLSRCCCFGRLDTDSLATASKNKK